VNSPEIGRRRAARGVASEAGVAGADQRQLTGIVAYPGCSRIIMLDGRQDEIGLQVIACEAVLRACRAARKVQVIGPEKCHAGPGLGVLVQAVRRVSKRADSRHRVVFHEHAAVATLFLPRSGEPVAAFERGLGLVPVIHHEAVTRAVQAIEQPEQLRRAAEVGAGSA